MAEDTHDQGTPPALRPRAGWEKSARNPEAVHGTPDVSAVPSTGYMDPSYQPPRLSPQAQLSSDAGEFDQSPYKEAQQGHRLCRAASPNSVRGGAGGCQAGEAASPELDGAPRADGRPGWDSRFYLERTAWEAQPRTQLLRPPSTNAFPGSGSGAGGSVRRSLPVGLTGGRGGGFGIGGGGFSDGGGGRSPGARRSLGYDSVVDGEGSRNVINSTDGNGTRTTILPGLYAASPPMWTSPYGDQPSHGPGRKPSSPGALPSPGPLPAAASPGSNTNTPRAPRIDLAESYVGRAYSPDQSYMRSCRGASSVDGGEPGHQQQGAEGGEGEGGVDGRGTHLPALERAYFGKKGAAGKGAAADKDAGGGGDKDKDKDRDRDRDRAAKEKASAQQAAIQALGAVYMPGGKLRLEPHSARETPRSSRVPPLYMRTCRSNDDDGERRGSGGGGGMTGGGGGRGAASPAPVHPDRDLSPGPGGGVWRPSGRQPIPEAAPPVPRNTLRSTSGEEKTETQEEADRRRAAPRNPALYSPERYPLVGQGWFMPPEKFPSNPAYAGVKAKYLETRPPRVNNEGEEEDGKTPHMPDIHSKPWLTPGKHLVTDSSAPPPKMTGPAGARPSYAFSPAATGASVATGTLRSNKGGTGRRGRSPVKGRKKRGGGSSSSRSRSSSRSGSGGDSGDEEVEGDREVLAVIGGVRLMSIIRRQNMTDEARLEAEEDAEMAAGDGEQQQREQRHGEEGEEAAAKSSRGEQAEQDDAGEGPGSRAAERRSSGLAASSAVGRADSGPGAASGGPGGGASRGGSSRGSRRSSRGSRGSARGGESRAEARAGSGGLGGRADADEGKEEGEEDGYGAGREAAVRQASDRREEADEEEEQEERQQQEEEQEEEEEQEQGQEEEEQEQEQEEAVGGQQAEEEEEQGAGGGSADAGDDDDDDDGLAAAAALAGLGDDDGDGEEAAAEEEDVDGDAAEEVGGDDGDDWE